FFTLSGFLITSLLLAEWDRGKGIDFGAFYLRRALRLLPALFMMVLVVWSLRFVTEPIASRQQVAGALFYYANIWRAIENNNQLGPFGHTWSLSIEEQFYLFWPVWLVVMLKRGLSRKTITKILVASICAVNLWRLVLWSQEVTHWRLYN